MPNDPVNVKGEIRGDKLIITVELTEEKIAAAKTTSTGRSLIIGSTRGHQRLVGQPDLWWSALVLKTIPRPPRRKKKEAVK